jgi:hypothetical protein
MNKICPACGVSQPDTAFGRNHARPDGLSFYCLACNRKRNRRWYQEHRRSLGHEVRDHSWIPEGYRWCPSCEQAVALDEYTRSTVTASGFGSQCRACKNVANSDAYFYRKYGLTRRAMRDLREQQGDRCAICADHSPQHLDHDHATGRVRQLLCQRCNHALGLFRDQPQFLRAAAEYVERHRARQAAAGEASAGSRPGTHGRPGDPPVGSAQRRKGRSSAARLAGHPSTDSRQPAAGEENA